MSPQLPRAQSVATARTAASAPLSTCCRADQTAAVSMPIAAAPKRIGISSASMTAMPPRSSERNRASGLGTDQRLRRPRLSRRTGTPPCW
jgi:hypothetical protein